MLLSGVALFTLPICTNGYNLLSAPVPSKGNRWWRLDKQP
jgi:hypothetical protein